MLEARLALEKRGDAPDALFRRKLLLDGTARRAMDILGKLNVVLFLPEDIAIVSGSPSKRRRYLDVILCQMDRRYCRSLSRYNRVVSQRNALLRQMRGRREGTAQLDYWDEQLSELGAYVLARRLWATRDLCPRADRVQKDLTGGRESLALAYQCTVEVISGDRPEPGETSGARPEGEQINRLRDAFAMCLHQRRPEELARGVTIMGPHRDDLRFLLRPASAEETMQDIASARAVDGVSEAGIDATIFGSRGQQRTIALALKLAEVELLHTATGKTPILLLDDMLSELDRNRSHYLLQALTGVEQALITTTDLGYFTPHFLEASDVVQWRHRQISLATRPHGASRSHRQQREA